MVDGTKTELSFEYAILATGSRPATIPGLIPNNLNILNSTSALQLKTIPKSMLVVGGGYIGLEIGSVYAALGTKVTVVEMLSGLLPGVDRDLVKVLQKRLDKSFEKIVLNTKVVEMKIVQKGIKVRFSSW